MLKVGRNDPCPCGSGKKYKKCCINKVESTQNSHQIQNKKVLQTQLERLPTSQLLENIKKAGVHLDEKIFIDDIEELGSANKLLNRWADQLKVEVEQLPPAFYLSIQILIKRLTPDMVLLEDLQDLMGDGYSLEKPDQMEDKLFIWWKLWKDLQEWIVAHQIPSLEKLDEMTRNLLPNSVLYWVSDFNQVLQEASKQDSRFISMRSVFADDFLKRFQHAPEQLKKEILRAKDEAVYPVV